MTLEELRADPSKWDSMVSWGMAEKYKRILRKMQQDPDDYRHGTHTGYHYGCRCERCKSAR